MPLPTLPRPPSPPPNIAASSKASGLLGPAGPVAKCESNETAPRAAARSAAPEPRLPNLDA